MHRSKTFAALVLVTTTLTLAGAPACQKKMTLEDCKARCQKVGDEQRAKCTESAVICDQGKKNGDESCNKMCDQAFTKP